MLNKSFTEWQRLPWFNPTVSDICRFKPR